MYTGIFYDNFLKPSRYIACEYTPYYLLFLTYINYNKMKDITTLYNECFYDVLVPFAYLEHYKSVTRIAHSLGCDYEIKKAAMLHDAIEDNFLTYHEIKEVHGEKISEIVYAVTDELGRNRKERHNKTYPKIAKNKNAVIVKLCDRIANIKRSSERGDSRIKMYLKEDYLFTQYLGSSFRGDNIIHAAWDLYEEAKKKAILKLNTKQVNNL